MAAREAQAAAAPGPSDSVFLAPMGRITRFSSKEVQAFWDSSIPSHGKVGFSMTSALPLHTR